jgi:hypothetical protein
MEISPNSFLEVLTGTTLNVRCVVLLSVLSSCCRPGGDCCEMRNFPRVCSRSDK